MEKLLEDLLSKHTKTQDLDNGIYELVLFINNTNYPIYATSETLVEQRAIDFLKEIYFESDVLDLWSSKD
jgi:hypothetical protein